MAYDGPTYGNRVDNFTERRLYGKVVDNVLSAATYYSRLVGMGKPMLGKTEDVTIKITSDAQAEAVVGAETLASAASNTTISLSYAQTQIQQPKVSLMVESFANAGSTGTIPLDAYKYDEAAAELLAYCGQNVAYGTGTGNLPNGLGNIVLDSGTIGGQSRSTYSQLNATVTSWSTQITLAKIATLHDAISSASISTETPNIGVTTKTVFSLLEQLYSPTVRASYESVGYDKVPLRGNGIQKAVDLQGGAGFNALSYRSIPIISDDYATSGVLFLLNERKFNWVGRTIVPDEYKGYLEKVSLGSTKALEGTGAAALELPSEYNGWFYQKPMLLPNQAATVARFWAIGQTVGKEFRKLGKGTGISTV